ncbi:Ethanolamine-phosphate cytidylyltransferase, putative [Perkinsus marinus ATCC 50983]|uniref:ethanolamine-phosphate cytidylyltransferase n=1 Tax=Perkinsus marinus (strain ATCC 50983 / TXsc) TaxID=423536 RepID=C5KPV3_PERM5|nr:Ethanolamine-phosphate cytidylyltransferase, putative [Perkinsus marinus ATCC 50983]EER13500.1 Ethanolamine-phosphate cytidylyltransferase, putative [Perkinsus marinus ATCC 50983]|eukprot:XP_002781705.1 Ethanolamine-phosphate cytidylyltransferase, putative [Perkinsus marinus ATCC 50983]
MSLRTDLTSQRLYLGVGALVGVAALYASYRTKLYIDRLRGKVAELQKELEREIPGYAHSTEKEKEPSTPEDHHRPVRVFMDGAFDLMHYGHMNAFRIARGLGDCLIVGVNSSETIAECKGTAPVLTDDERCEAVRACVWVDEVIPKSPYIMTPEYIQNVLFDEYKIDYIIHGDDPCLVDGKDVYASAKAAGKYKSIPRTEGVSTSDIVGRAMILATSHHISLNEDEDDGKVVGRKRASSATLQLDMEPSVSSGSRFFPTERLVSCFSARVEAQKPGQRVVYIDGAFDMFHAGHISTLKKARELGDYLIVGVHSDVVVNKIKGGVYPCMNLKERVLSVLGCKYVDDVLADAPFTQTEDLILQLGVSVVVKGTERDIGEKTMKNMDPYRVPREMGILMEIKSESTLTVSGILERIDSQRHARARVIANKMEKEREYTANKHKDRLVTSNIS